MIPLIDADVLVYEVGFGCEVAWEGPDPPPFDKAAELLDNRITHICNAVGATAPPVLFLTGKNNFREKIAVTRPYKANRGAKPFHYYNLRAYMQGKWDAIVVDGMEADDAMAIAQDYRTIICTRDKDLRQVAGAHYGWELGNQPSFGPRYIDELGWIELSEDHKKLKGGGMKFFYAQCLMGDSVDNIPGLPKCGPKGAFETLSHITLLPELFEAVRGAYRAFYGDVLGDERLLEMGQLLWMVRELDDEGKPKIWEFPRMDAE